MDDIRMRGVLLQLRELGLVEMKPTGRWGLSHGGESFLDQLDVMRQLDNRPAADAQGRRRTGRSTPARGAGSGDDVRPARRARRKGSRS